MGILIKSAVETCTGRFLAVVLLFLLADAMIEVQARIPRFVPLRLESTSRTLSVAALVPTDRPVPSHNLGWLIGQGLRRIKKYAD
jgi:hypothetical protein